MTRQPSLSRGPSPRRHVRRPSHAPYARPPTIDHPATSLGSRCAIATSTATIRAPVDIQPSTIANVSGDRRSEFAAAPFAIFLKIKKNWKRARPPTSRHPEEPIGTGVVIGTMATASVIIAAASTPRTLTSPGRAAATSRLASNATLATTQSEAMSLLRCAVSR